MRRVLLTAGAIGLAALGGCSADTHGVRVQNQTDHIVRAELLQLRKDGEMTVYSTQTLAPGAEFKHMIEGEERRPGMRVRFMLSEQKLVDGNWVMLNLPDTRDRTYDLMLIGGHLSAKELSKQAKPRSW